MNYADDFALMSDRELLEMFVAATIGNRTLEQIPFPRLGWTLNRDLMIPPTLWNIGSFKMSGSITPGNAVGAQDRDWHIAATCEQHFDAVRLILLSAEAANNVAGVTAAIAPSANYNTPNTPTGSWTTFTWSGSGSTTMPTGSGSGATARFATVTSDWMSVQSVARDDSPVVDVPIWMLRIHLPAGGGTYNYTTTAAVDTTWNTNAALNYRRFYRIQQQNINSVGTPAAFTATSEGNTMPPFILQFRMRGRVISFMTAGDSFVAGSLTDGRMLPAGLRAAYALSSPTNMPVLPYISGWASQPSADYLANAKTLISAAPPQVAAYQVYSSNDSTLSTAVMNTQLAQAMDFVTHCRANGTLPVLLGPCPLNSDNLTVSTLKVTMTNKLREMRNRGILVVDYYNALTDFATINGSGGYSWISGYNSDSTHPNNTGAEVMSSILQRQLQKIMNANGAAVSV